MPRMGHANPRTYGTKLLMPKYEDTETASPVTSRVCDVEHYELTGELKYIDEGEVVMPSVDTIENAKRMRADLKTLERFEAVGSYSDVAKKYLTSKTTSHAHLMHLRHLATEQEKKVKEERQMINKAIGACKPEVEETADIAPEDKTTTSDESKGTVAVDCLKEGKEEAENSIVTDYRESFGEDLRIPADEPEDKELYEHVEHADEPLSEETLKKINDRVEEVLTKKNEADLVGPIEVHDEGIDTPLGKMSAKTGRYMCVDCGKGILDGVAVFAQSGLCKSCSETLVAEEKECGPCAEDKISAEEFDRIMSEVEFQWTALPITKAQTIEELWKRLESTTCALHKMTIEQAERDFQKRLAGVIEGC